jgi:hypothetical protein
MNPPTTVGGILKSFEQSPFVLFGLEYFPAKLPPALVKLSLSGPSLAAY